MENKKSAVTVRKAEDDADNDDPEEEMKIEKFYSLLRSFRDTRNRRRKELDDLERNDSNKKKKMKRIKEETSSWVPSFEWEDFTTEIEFRRPPLVLSTPCDHRDKDSKKKKNQDDGLDLKLAL